jgi:hypothetical protein
MHRERQPIKEPVCHVFSFRQLLPLGNYCLYLCDLDADHPPFRKLQVAIYADDHLPPHFHIEGRGFRAVVEIDTMVVRAGNPSPPRVAGQTCVRKAPEALKWAHDNIAFLRTEWLRLNRRA